MARTKDQEEAKGQQQGTRGRQSSGSTSTALERPERHGSMQAGSRSPFGFMRRFSEDMERLFDEFWRSPLPMSPRMGMGGEQAMASWSPAIEVMETDGMLMVRADLPGMRAEDVQVEIEDDCLVIRGEREQEHEEEEGGYYHSERSYGSFYRCVQLPEGVDQDEVRARFTNGVLEIEMPAPEKQQRRGRSIPVES